VLEKEQVKAWTNASRVSIPTGRDPRVSGQLGLAADWTVPGEYEYNSWIMRPLIPSSNLTTDRVP
jgi:hypothetical protein